MFARFFVTQAGSDSSGSFIIGFGSAPSRCGPAVACHAGQSRGLPVPAQGASVHARVSDHVGSSRRSRYRAGSCCLPHTRKTSAPEKRHFRGSMAGLHAPLSTLHGRPRGRPRMTRGQCGSLLLHCDGLAPSTPCRSPGAPRLDPKGAKRERDSERAHRRTGERAPDLVASGLPRSGLGGRVHSRCHHGLC